MSPQGVFIVKHGGTYIQVGMVSDFSFKFDVAKCSPSAKGNSEALLPVTTILVKEITFKGSFRYGPGDYSLSIGLVAAGKYCLVCESK